MDVYGALRDLYEEKRRLDVAIAALEASIRQGNGAALKRRGRKSMSAEERVQVSERMRKYWEIKRIAAMHTPSANGSGHINGHVSGVAEPPATVA